MVTFLFGDKKVTPPSDTADENDFPFSEDRVLPDPCRGPSFLVSARKEAKKPPSPDSFRRALGDRKVAFRLDKNITGQSGRVKTRPYG